MPPNPWELAGGDTDACRPAGLTCRHSHPRYVDSMGMYIWCTPPTTTTTPLLQCLSTPQSGGISNAINLKTRENDGLDLSAREYVKSEQVSTQPRGLSGAWVQGHLDVGQGLALKLNHSHAGNILWLYGSGQLYRKNRKHQGELL